jgi:hypothetical protein
MPVLLGKEVYAGKEKASCPCQEDIPRAHEKDKKTRRFIGVNRPGKLLP